MTKTVSDDMTPDEETQKLLNKVVSRLGLEPRALALKGELCSPLSPTLPNKSHSFVDHSFPTFGPFRGPSVTVHGQNEDNQALLALVCPVLVAA